jgi:hypothetical protein
MKGIPDAPVIKITESHYVVQCPYCNGEHFHGKGEGHRVAHCGDGFNRELCDGGYNVTLSKTEGAKS